MKSKKTKKNQSPGDLAAGGRGTPPSPFFARVVLDFLDFTDSFVQLL